MKFTMTRSVFQNHLGIVQRAISSKTTIQILTGLKLVLSDEGLLLTGSNGDVSIESFIPVDDAKANLVIEQTGGIVLPAGFLRDVVSNLPDDTLTIVATQTQAEITSGGATFNVNGYDITDYPQLPVVEENNILALPGRILNQVIKETIIAASKQENRPILTGVHLIVDGTELKAVATDTHRLSQRELNVKQATSAIDVVIPAASLKEVSQAFGDDENIVEISTTANQILFKSANLSLYSRLLEGNYPDTDRLIPTSHELEVIFDVKTLSSAIARASLMSHKGGSGNNIVRLELTNNQVMIHSNSPEIGYVDESIPFEQLTGSDLTISFNPDYVKTALSVLQSEKVSIKFISPVRPFTLVPVDEETSFVQLITPVRTN